MARKSSREPGIIAMTGSFHYKTINGSSAPWDRKHRAAFRPLLLGFRHVPYGRSDRLRRMIAEDAVAVILEPHAGASG